MKPEDARRGDHMLYGIFGFYPRAKIKARLRNFKITDLASIVISGFKLSKNKK